jgi:hypothetical protein
MRISRLHSTSRFTKALPHGDEGTNAVKTNCALHVN